MKPDLNLPSAANSVGAPVTANDSRQWARLSKEQLHALAIPTHETEVVLIDASGVGGNQVPDLCLNAQRRFPAEVIASIPELPANLLRVTCVLATASSGEILGFNCRF